MHEFVEQLAKDERLRSLSFQNVKVVPFLGTPGAIQSDSWIQQHIPIHLQRKSEIYYTVQVITCLHQCMWKVQKKKS